MFDHSPDSQQKNESAPLVTGARFFFCGNHIGVLSMAHLKGKYHMEDVNDRAVIGGNRPPPDEAVPAPYDLALAKVNAVYDEAKLWLDGAKVESQEMADDIANLLSLLREARKFADEQRIIAKKPFDEAAAAVQAQFKPLIEKVDLAVDGCKKTLAPWLAKVKADQETEAKRKREEAEAKQAAAREALRSTDPTNLEARAAAEKLAKDAKRATKAADKASKQKAHAGGSMGRATSLRTTHVAVMVNAKEAIQHYWVTERDAIIGFITELAQRDARTNVQSIPGFEIREEQQAV